MKFVVILFILSACGGIREHCEGAEFTTDNGICVTTNGLPIDRVALQELIDEAYLRYLQIYPEDIEEIERKTKVVKPEIIFMEDMEDAGVTVFSSVYVRWVSDCLGNTALGHELLHLFRHLASRGGDKEHEDSKLFMTGDNTRYELYMSAENMINTEMCERVCGDCRWLIVLFNWCWQDSSCPEGWRETCIDKMSRSLQCYDN
jgi:hypothetical protein